MALFYIQRSSPVQLIKGHQHPPPVSFLSLPNLCATKFSFTNRLSLKVCYLFSTDQQKALLLLISSWSYNTQQVWSVMNLVGKLLSWSSHSLLTPAHTFPCTQRRDFHHFFFCFLDQFIKVAVPVHLPKWNLPHKKQTSGKRVCVSREELWAKAEPGLWQPSSLRSLLPGNCVVDGRKVFEVSQQKLFNTALRRYRQEISGL